MDLKELNYIVTIAEEGSISKAAAKLYMAQSSLSQFLQLYEAELGTPIFMRTSKGVRPTSSGQVFINHARQILLHYHRAQNELWDIEELGGGQIELGVSTFRGTYLLPKVLKKFHDLYPKVHVNIREKDSVHLEERVLDGSLDMALIALPAVKLKDHFDFLMRDEICIVASKGHPVMKYVRPGHPITGRAWVSLKNASAYEFILGPSQTILGTMARRVFYQYGIQPFSRNTNVTAPFAASMAREGIALTLTYYSCMVPDDRVEYLSIGNDGVFLDLALAYPGGEYRSKAVKALGKLMHETYS
ncbi:MAG: LysR family transcriptional regulator [Lachnospiraceae bacterium]